MSPGSGQKKSTRNPFTRCWVRIDVVVFDRLVDRGFQLVLDQSRRQVDQCSDWAGEGDVVAGRHVCRSRANAAMNVNARWPAIERGS
jgi:hypothetical protein